MSFDEGWHVDPTNPRQERYWNGTAWSGQWREHGFFHGDVTPRPIEPRAASEAYVDRSSRAAWILASSPLWLPVPYAALSLFGMASAAAAESRLGYILVIGLLLVLAARRDQAVLSASRVSSPASPLWTLLSPLAYLIARQRSLRDVPGYRSSPLLVHVLCIGVLVAVVVALGLVSGLPFLMFGRV